ncbi:MAG: PQQ-binding-like beta-propeller repeat protein, partial [Acidobacteria bacterium]|nr:PQQ-binding-like beta-propeller repeat protein [Acidobacteriota bacterium]
PAGTVTAPLLVRAGWVIAATDNQLSAYHAADGKPLWHRELAPITVRPAVDGDVVYVSIADGRVVALDLPTGAVRWERHLGGAPAEPLALGDRVYVGAIDKHFYCLKAASGEIDWRVRVGAEVRAAAALDDERVYFASLQNVMHALDGTNGAQQWKRGFPFRPIAGPVVIGAGVTVPGSVAEIRVFDRRTGAPRGRLGLGTTLATAPAIFVESTTTGDQLALAAITGSLDAQWKLSLGVPGPPEGPALAPLTELPGEVVKLPGLPTS